MAESFGVKMGIEGEKEFKAALSDINQAFKVLGSEMKLVESQFAKNDTSVGALTARNQVLNKEIEEQQKKIDLLRSALNNAAESFGENDKRTQNWQIQLNNAEATLNGMKRELKENNDALEEANENYDEAEDTLKDVDKEMKDVSDSADDMGKDIREAGDEAEKSESKFKGLGDTLKTIGAAMGTVVVAAGAAAVELGKAVVSAYADYEQLIGGVDTLFEDSSQKVQDYAANAYKTAGMSANEYMETVTGFSAALINSLGGDTEKAAEMADMAISDMSDNANKMGSSLESIKLAYAGFSRGQFTLLDNLKLGYGGTKSEMERLLQDAQAISGIEYDLNNYADIVDAIHVIQNEMGITGTTAKEAEHTIAGSISSMQSAFQNLIVGFGRADADMTMLCNNVVDAFEDVITNITPVIENIVSALPTVTGALLDAVAGLLPVLLETVTNLFSQVLNTLLQLIPTLIPAAVEALMTIVNTIIENLPLLLNAAVQIVVSLINGISEALPTLIPTAVQAIITLVQGLVDSLPMILDAALQLITGLAQGLLDAIPVLVAALPDIINSIISFLVASIPQIIEAGIQLLTSLVQALPEIIVAIVEAIPLIIDGIVTAVVEAIPLIIQAGVDLLVSLIQNLPLIIETIVTALPTIITAIVEALTGNIDKIIMAGAQLFMALIENLPTIIVELVKAVPKIITALVDGFAEGFSSMAEVGLNLIQGIWNGIGDATSWLYDKISGFCGGVMDKIKDLFGIHSPSREMAWVGEMLVDGLSGSIEDNSDSAVKAAADMSAGILDVMQGLSDELETSIPTDFAMNTTASVDAITGGATGTSVSSFGSMITIQEMIVRSEDDIRKVSQELYNLLQTSSRAAGGRIVTA